MTPFNVAIVRWVRGAFVFRGRSTRSEYWWPRLLVFVVNAVCLGIFLGEIGPDGLQALMEWTEQEQPTFATLDLGPLSSLAKFALTFVVVFGLLTFFPDLAVSWRRFQDLGRPGWFHLLFWLGSALAPIVTLAELIWLAFPGTRGPNRYGEDPLFDQADIF